MHVEFGKRGVAERLAEALCAAILCLAAANSPDRRHEQIK